MNSHPPIRVYEQPTNGECLLYLSPGSHCAKPFGHEDDGDPYHQDEISVEHMQAHCG